jgi:electron transfer flavoprotein alpha subunit
MRIAVLVKQVPKFEEMELGADGRLRRDGIELEMNPYCRRAIAQAVALGARTTVFTLGPPSAEDVLREAIAWGEARSVDIDGVLVTDPAFTGSDTLATALALSAALRRVGPFDLVLTGRNSVDADTGQVGPAVAQLCDLPFLTGVRHLGLDGDTVSARCEHDDGWVQAEVQLPALLSCAERLIDPAKVDPPERAKVAADRIHTLRAADLGEGPWGQAASPTWVGPVKVMSVTRAHLRWPDAPLDEQVRRAVHALHERNALVSHETVEHPPVPPSRPEEPRVIVVVEPDRPHMTRELLGAAAQLTGNVLAITLGDVDTRTLATWGADEVVELQGKNIEEDVAEAVSAIAALEQPWAMLTASTAWGREVAARSATWLHAGLTGDAMELERDGDRLIAWKPAFGGQLVAAIGCTSPIQCATVRAGVLPHLIPRDVAHEPQPTTWPLHPNNRVQVLARTREDDIDLLAEAKTVIGVGQGVPPEKYAELEPLRSILAAEIGASRKVTDKGWLPRARQIGITGRAIAPRLYVSIGASGKFNHMIGVRAADTVLAINPDAGAPVFAHADVGIISDWEAVLPLLVNQLAG